MSERRKEGRGRSNSIWVVFILVALGVGWGYLSVVVGKSGRVYGRVLDGGKV